MADSGFSRQGTSTPEFRVKTWQDLFGKILVETGSVNDEYIRAVVDPEFLRYGKVQTLEGLVKI